MEETTPNQELPQLVPARPSTIAIPKSCASLVVIAVYVLGVLTGIGVATCP